MRLLRRAIELLMVVTMLATITTCGTATEGPSSEEPPSPTEAEPTNPPMPTPRPTETPLPTPTPALPTATPTPAGHAPVIVNLEAQSISDGERFARVDLDECVIDEDHKAKDIDWQISGNDELGLRTIGSHLLVFLPLPDWTGSETLLFEACDPDGLCASQEVEFTVRAENDAPQVTVGGQIIMPGESFVPIVLDDWVADEDNGPDEMTWAVVNKGKLEVTVEAGVVTIGLPAEEWLGQEVVLFEACDPDGACGTKEAHFEAMARTEKEAEVTYIGNAGFMVTVGDKKILIDAALRDPAVPGEVTTLIENAQPPFDDVDLILTSHTHFDHFTAETVLRHLEHNPAAIFVAGHDAVSAVNTMGDVRAQTVPLRLAQIAGERRQVVVNGIGLEALFLSHGGPILNLGFVVTIEGRRFFHTGDIDPDSVPVSELQGHGLPEKQIDVAFVAHFMLITPEQHAHVTKGIGAAHVVPMHYQYTIPPPDYDLMADYFPQAVVLRESMATWVLPGSAPAGGEGDAADSPLVRIPAGPYVMGSEDGPADAPPHTVVLDEYLIDRYEVTNAQFALFLDEQDNQPEAGVRWLDEHGARPFLRRVDGGWQPVEGYENHPVVEVTWYGALAYCAWRGGRLPTEAEWEKAARGTTESAYPWGEELDCDHANYRACSIGETVTVGSYPLGVSSYGVHDMAGNAAEWTADWYVADYYVNSPAENPQGPEEPPGQRIASRGGSWYSSGTYLRAFHRNHEFRPTNSFDNVGFRCAESP